MFGALNCSPSIFKTDCTAFLSIVRNVIGSSFQKSHLCMAFAFFHRCEESTKGYHHGTMFDVRQTANVGQVQVNQVLLAILFNAGWAKPKAGSFPADSAGI